jgi:hypothetical protein
MQPNRGGTVAFMVHHLKVDGFDDFKSMFDADPAGRKQAAKGVLRPPPR